MLSDSSSKARKAKLSDRGKPGSSSSKSGASSVSFDPAPRVHLMTGSSVASSSSGAAPRLQQPRASDEQVQGRQGAADFPSPRSASASSPSAAARPEYQATGASLQADLRLKEAQLKHVTKQLSSILKQQDVLVNEKRHLHEKYHLQSAEAREAILKLQKKNRELKLSSKGSTNGAGAGRELELESERVEREWRQRLREDAARGTSGRARSRSSSQEASAVAVGKYHRQEEEDLLAASTMSGRGGREPKFAPTSPSPGPRPSATRRSSPPIFAHLRAASSSSSSSIGPGGPAHQRQGSATQAAAASAQMRQTNKANWSRHHLVQQQQISKMQDEFTQLLSTHENYVMIFTELLRKKDLLVEAVRNEAKNNMKQEKETQVEKAVRVERIFEEEKRLIEAECSAFLAQREIEWGEDKKALTKKLEEAEGKRDAVQKKLEKDREQHELELEHWKRKHSYYKDRFGEAEVELKEQLDSAQKAEDLAAKKVKEVEAKAHAVEERLRAEHKHHVADSIAKEAKRQETKYENLIATHKVEHDSEMHNLQIMCDKEKQQAVREAELAKNREAQELLYKKDEQMQHLLAEKDQQVKEAKVALKKEFAEKLKEERKVWEEHRKTEADDEKKRQENMRKIREREHQSELQELRAQHDLAMANEHGELMHKTDQMMKDRDVEREKRIKTENEFDDMKAALTAQIKELQRRLGLWIQGYGSVKHTKLAQEAFRRARASDSSMKRLPSLTERHDEKTVLGRGMFSDGGSGMTGLGLAGLARSGLSTPGSGSPTSMTMGRTTLDDGKWAR